MLTMLLLASITQGATGGMTLDRVLERHQQYLDRIHTVDATIEIWDSSDGGVTWSMTMRSRWLKDGPRVRGRVRGRRMYQGGQTFLPLRVNQAGVIPIIFAVSILLFPVQLASYFQGSEIPVVASIATGIVSFFSPNTLIYSALYFLLTIGFTYFYTAFTFKPDETAEQLRKNGGYIPGIRPGRPTQDYLARVVSRITLAGALFLGIVAVSPTLVGIAFPDLGAIGLGGTSLLIVVSVVVETMKQIEAQLMMRNYEGFIR